MIAISRFSRDKNNSGLNSITFCLEDNKHEDGIFNGKSLTFTMQYFLLESYFDLSKRTMRKNSNKKILLNQTLKVIEITYRDYGGYDMCYYEFLTFIQRDVERGIQLSLYW